MTFVVATTAAPLGGAEACVSALERELLACDEVVWVGAGSPPSRLPVVRVDGGGASRGQLYAAGLRAAQCPWVAFTDSNTALVPGWRGLVGKALEDHAVVAGPVLPGTPRTCRSWAGFFIEYGPHAVHPYTSAQGDPAANNIAYRREVLEGVVEPGMPLWKSEVHDRLRARGVEATMVGAMAVTSTKRYGLADLTVDRLAHGRLFGAQRAQRMSPPRRLVASVACGVLPFLAYLRLARVVGRSSALRGPFVGVSPLVGVALVMWSAGEAIGYATRSEGRRDVY